MVDAVTSSFSILSLLKKAYDLYEGCRKAPEEIRLAGDHVHGMKIILEGIRSDMIDNPRSSINQRTDIGRNKAQRLRKLLKTCKASMQQTENLLKKFHSFGHVRLWDKYKWSSGGKAEIALMKNDLILSSIQLGIFVQQEQNVNVMYALESTFEKFIQRFDGMENLRSPQGRPTRRTRADSSVGRCLVAGFFISKLKAIVRKKRSRKQKKRAKSPTKPGSKIRPVARVSSGLGRNKKRDALLATHAANITKELNRPGRRPGTPDAVYDDSGLSSTSPSLIRRSSSMSQLVDIINTQADKARKNREYLECWRLGKGSFVGFKGPSASIQHKRGQMQLRKMAQTFQEASKYDTKRAVNVNEKIVQQLLQSRNKQEKSKNSGMRWVLLAGRIVGRDPGTTGVVEVEKLVVILSRRKA